ncbi:hypothetical protein ADK49_17515 [Streptomyces sp. WM6349]|nr:hypothetical protein ADK49_17515 [Streptomyces sp. WM6349]
MPAASGPSGVSPVVARPAAPASAGAGTTLPAVRSGSRSTAAVSPVPIAQRSGSVRSGPGGSASPAGSAPERSGAAAAHRARSSEVRADSKRSKRSAASFAYGGRWRATCRSSSQHRSSAPRIASRHSDGVASTTAAASANPLSHAATPSSAPLISASRCSGPSGG